MEIRIASTANQTNANPPERKHMRSSPAYWCPKKTKRWLCRCLKPVLWELNLFPTQKVSLVPVNLHSCWRREWKRPIERFQSRGQQLCKVYWNKRKRFQKKSVQLPQDWFDAPTWPSFYCFRTPIWPAWRHVKTLHTALCLVHDQRDFRNTCARRKYTNDGSFKEDDGLSQWSKLPKHFYWKKYSMVRW